MSEFYSPPHRLIALQDVPNLNWEEISTQVPLLPRGWFELSRLPLEDRKEFLGDFWLSKLGHTPALTEAVELKIREFFDSLEDLGIFVTQATAQSPFEVHMHYELKGGEGFFYAAPPASEDTRVHLQRQFAPIILPPDYLAFLSIHDGFTRYSDTGILKSKEMARVYQKLQHLLAATTLMHADGELIDPTTLIPFYESAESHLYQCFYADWHPDDEMGNVSFSTYDACMSDLSDPESYREHFAFPTFAEWLVFYLDSYV